MKYPLLLWTILSWIPLVSNTQPSLSPGYSLHYADLFSFVNNTSALAQLKQNAAGVSMLRKFLMNELTDYRLAVGLKSGSGNFAVLADINGNPFFKQRTYHLAYARHLGKHADIGLRFLYQTVGIAGYGKISKPGFGLGFVLHANEKLHTGVQLNNFFIGKTNPLSGLTSFSLGIGYEPSQKFLLTIQISKEEENLLNMSSGLFYRFVNQFETVLLISSANSSIIAGINLHTKKYRLGLNAGFHPQLGISPGMNLIFKMRSPHGKN